MSHIRKQDLKLEIESLEKRMNKLSIEDNAFTQHPLNRAEHIKSLKNQKNKELQLIERTIQTNLKRFEEIKHHSHSIRSIDEMRKISKEAEEIEKTLLSLHKKQEALKKQLLELEGLLAKYKSSPYVLYTNLWKEKKASQDEFDQLMLTEIRALQANPDYKPGQPGERYRACDLLDQFNANNERDSTWQMLFEKRRGYTAKPETIKGVPTIVFTPTNPDGVTIELTNHSVSAKNLDDDGKIDMEGVHAMLDIYLQSVEYTKLFTAFITAETPELLAVLEKELAIKLEHLYDKGTKEGISISPPTINNKTLDEILYKNPTLSKQEEKEEPSISRGMVCKTPTTAADVAAAHAATGLERKRSGRQSEPELEASNDDLTPPKPSR